MTILKILSSRRCTRLVVPVCIALAVSLLCLWRTIPAHAAGVVTDCTGQGLADAMNAGSGDISFSCGPDPVVLTITQAGGFNVIPGNFYTIDGGGLVTLSGAGVNRLFDVRVNGALTLTHITLSDGYAFTGGNLPDLGGAILDEGSGLELDDVTIRNSQSATAGGAIEIITGIVLIKNSLIEDNQSADGGGIDSGSAVAQVSTLTLQNTIVRHNLAQVSGFNGNGGGLNAGGTVVIDHSQFVNNTGWFGGGIYFTRTLTLTDSTLDGNQADAGGGIYNLGGTAATLSNVTLSRNFGGEVGGGIQNHGTMTVSNVTFSANWSNGRGGGISNEGIGTLTLNNVTLSGNWAYTGGGIYNSTSVASRTIRLRNTIVANSPSGGNCHADSTNPISLGNNLSSDDSCNAFFTQGTDWNTANPNLGPLGNNGGYTLTHIPFPLPSAVNRAIDGGNGCPSTDQRGVSRPQGGACDIGAVEYRTGELTPWLYLPLVVR